jgi:hypothetical protein
MNISSRRRKEKGGRKSMSTKPSEIFASALSLELDKKIVLSFTDRKKFLSMRTGLHTAKRALGDTTIKIKSSNENTITLQRYEESGFSVEVATADEELEHNETFRSERRSSPSKEAMQRILSISKEKDLLFEEMKTIISIIGKDQAVIDQSDPESELFSLMTKCNKLQSEIRKLRVENGIIERFPTDEPPNEESLIEP